MKRITSWAGRNSVRSMAMLICIVMVVQLFGLHDVALGAGQGFFRGYNAENIITGSGGTFVLSHMEWSGSSIVMKDTENGEAYGEMSLDESGHDISTSVDLGGLEIDFSTLASITAEAGGNDVPSAVIEFHDSGDQIISSVQLNTSADFQSTASGSVTETLSSGAGIPEGTRLIAISLSAKNTVAGSTNTVSFGSLSLVVHDSGTPSCSVSYNNGWTNQDVEVSVTASDSDSGLEGIYVNGENKGTTSPYVFTVSANSTYEVYSKDYADKTSDVKTVIIDKIDKSTPTAPSGFTLSHTGWTNSNVTATMPALPGSSDAPERYVYRYGSSGDWSDFPESGLTVIDGGQYTLNVAVVDEAGNMSSAVTGQIKIDKSEPVIGDVEETVSSGRCDVTVSITDSGGSGLKVSKYAQGEQDAAYFQTGGTTISSNTFSVTTGGIYTIYAEDNAGNTRVEKYTFNTAPSLIKLVNLTIDEDETREVVLDVTDESELDKLTVTAASSNTTLVPLVIVNKSESGITLSIIPASNLSGGPVTITVEVTDEFGEKTTDSFTVTVTPDNDPPVAVDDTAEVNEDESVRIDVLANDYDIIDVGDKLSIQSPGTPQHGTAAIVSGKIKYTPAANYTGEDSFVYTLTDDKGSTDTATVTVTVKPVNDAPVAADDTAQTAEDTPVNIHVLDNDTDVDAGDSLSFISVGTTAGGTATKDDGAILFTPNDNFYGSTSFTYTIEDEGHLTSMATVRVTVTPSNDAPVFTGVASEYSAFEDITDYPVAFEIKDIETPSNSLMLQAVSNKENILPNKNIKIEGLGDNNDAVTLKFTPLANKYGDVEITLSLGDGFTTVTKKFTLHIQNVNDVPVARIDDISYEEGETNIRISAATLLANDTDIDSGTLTIIGKGSDPSYGTLTIEGGTEGIPVTAFLYTPDSEYSGQTSFTYIVSDGEDTASGTCRLIVEALNQAPSISGLAVGYSTDEDTTKSIYFNISDRETTNPASLLVTAWSGKIQLVSNDGINITNNGDGTCTLDIDPMDDANGTGKIWVSVSDGNSATTTSFSLTVNPTQDKPVAMDDEIYVPLSGSQTFSVIENDYDVDGDALSVSDWTTGTLSGTLTYNSTTQIFTYTAKDGEEGIKTFTYDLTDGTDTDSGAVTLNITDQGYPPELGVIADQYMNEDGTLDVTVHVTDKDMGDTFTFNMPGSSNADLLPEVAENMSITHISGGTYKLTLKPAADANGVTTVSLTVKDSKNNTDTADFGLTVLPVNDAPRAVADEVEVDEDHSVTFNPAANDTDVEGDAKWVNYIEAPAHGVIVRDGNTFTYTPHLNWYGTETLDYTATDGQDTSHSTVTIVVNSVNDAPVAYANWLVVVNSEGASNTVNVIGNDWDVEGNTLSVTRVLTLPQYGTAVDNGNGTFTYTRTSAPSDAADSFQYEITDGELTATAWVYVDDHFDASLECDSIEVDKSEDDTPFTITLPISNPNSVDYSVSFDTTALGSFTMISPNQYTFTPAKDANGYQAIRFTASGEGESSYAYIYLRLYAVNDTPVIDEYNSTPVTAGVPTSTSCAEDSAGVTFDIDYHDVDTGDANLTVYAYTINTVSQSSAPLAVDLTVTDHNDGTATVTARPSIANAFGNTDIIVGVSDGIAEVSHTVNLTVTPVDDAPVVSAISRKLFEDTTDTFALITPNTDVDGDTLELTVISQPAHGDLTDNGDGTVTYSPDANYVGDDSFGYTITDQTKSVSSTVTLTVEPVNDPPVITNLSYFQTTEEDKPLDVALTVSDVDDTDLEYTFTSSNTVLASISGLSVRRDSGDNMIITVDPEANAYGTAIITVTVSDGEASATGAFKLMVTPVNDDPVAVDEAVSVDEAVWPVKTTSVVIDLTDNISDAEGMPQISAITDISIGKAANNNGRVTYTADGNFNGTATFKFTVLDADGATATGTVTINVTPKNDPPEAVDDTGFTTDEDQPINIDVLHNDTDAENDTLSVQSVTNLLRGTVDIEADNTVTYRPDTDYYGNDSFTYTVSDGNGGTDSATVYLTVEPQNDAPNVIKYEPDTGDWTMGEDSTAPFHFKVEDPESDAINLIITITSMDTTKLKTAGILLSSDNDEGERVLTVTPEKNATDLMPIKIAVTDGAKSTEETFDINITAVNDAPEIDTPAVTTLEETPVSGQVTAVDVDSSSLTFSLADSGEPAHGTVTVNANGTYTYTPVANYCGPDSFSVSVSDGDGGTNTGVVLVTVTPVNDDPTAINDEETTPEDTPVVVNILVNDSDPDLEFGDELTIVDNISPQHGSVAIIDDNGTKKLRYTPNSNWNGTDVFSYTIKDSEDKSSTAQVTITVTPVNDTPGTDVVGDDAVETMEEQPIDIAVTLNDDIDEQTNPEIEDVTVDAIVTQPSYGIAVLKNSKTITYTPEENFPAGNSNGEDSFTYRAIDVGGKTHVFTVNITVTPYNDTPEINAIGNVTMDEEATQNITVAVRDIEDLNGDLSVTATHNKPALFDTITASAVSPGTEDGSFTLTLSPKKDMVGTATITVTVTDSGGLTAQTTFTVTVNNVNDDPSAQNDTATVDEGGSVIIDVLANDDIDTNNGGDTLTIVSCPDTTAMGTVEKVVDGGKEKLKFTATDTASSKSAQTVTFSYAMHDAAYATTGVSSAADVTVTINPVNDAPTITDIADVVGENKIFEDAVNGTGNLSFSVNDEEDAAEALVVTFASSNATLFPANKITLSHVTGGQYIIKAVSAANKYGTGTITVTVKDLGVPIKTSTDTFTVEVESVNDEPANGDDTATVAEDGEISIAVLANDDVDYATQPETLSLVSVTKPPHGNATINAANQTIKYEPDPDYFGTDSFTYDMHDSQDSEEGVNYTFTVTVTVTPVNDAPVIHLTDSMAQRDGYAVWYEVNEGQLKSGIPFTVKDVDNTNVAVSKSSSKTRLVGSTGMTLNKISTVGDTDYYTIDVQPSGVWNGQAVITLTANDGALSDTGQLLFVVNSVNSTPVAADDNLHINEDTLTTLDILANDDDEDLATDDDEAITINSVTYDTGDSRILSLAPTVAHDGINIKTSANFNGGPITFTYTIKDTENAVSDPATVTVYVDQVNDAPMTMNDSADTLEEQAIDIDVLDNDSDVDQAEGINAAPGAEVLSVDRTGLSAPSHGTAVVVLKDGKDVIRYTPDVNFNGTDAFTYYAYDGEAKTLGTVTVEIVQVNDSPVAVNDEVSTTEDHNVTVNVLANDSDVDRLAGLNKNPANEVLSISINGDDLAAPSHGAIGLNGDYTITYTPNVNYYGTDSFEYYVMDSADVKVKGTVNVTVQSVNDLPQFDVVPEAMMFNEDGSQTKPFAVSDIETTEAQLEITAISSSNFNLVKTSGVTFGRDGEGNRIVTITPEVNQNGGPVTITLQEKDMDNGINTCTFTVNVLAVNDPPAAQDVTDTINEDASYSIAWATITSDPDIATNGDSLSVSIETGAAHGTASVSGADITYTPAANWNGTDSFTYTVSDGEAFDTATITINVNQMNDTPAAVGDNSETNEDMSVVIPVLVNDSDADMTESLNQLPITESLTIANIDIVQPGHGSAQVVLVEGVQKIEYTPNSNYNGPDSFTYKVTDHASAQSEATVSIAVHQVNDNPVAMADSTSTEEHTPVDFDVLANDTDVDTDSALNKDILHSHSFTVTGISFIGEGHGTISESAGVITYSPYAGFNGTVQISYTLSDGYGGTATGLLTIDVGSVNDAPDAVDDSVEVEEDHVARVNILANDVDLDMGDTKTLAGLTGTSGLPGVISFEANGDVTFTPDTDYYGVFSIGYTIEDSVGATDSGVFAIKITPVNDAPTALDDMVTMDEDDSADITISPLIDDVDLAGSDGDELSVSVKASDMPGHGSLTTSGALCTYSPDADWNGEDEFTYTVTDRAGETATATITITVEQVNDKPVALDDLASTDEDTTLSVPVMTNDSDKDTLPGLNAHPEDEVLGISVVQAPAHGGAVVSGGQINYMPDPNYNGPDSFTYELSDGEDSDTAIVSITVKQVNDLPIAQNDIAITNDEEMVIIDALSNDTDVDTQSGLNAGTLHILSDLRITGVNTPAHGNAVAKNNNIQYTPADGFAGTDSFVYVMADGHGGTASATVSVTVLSVNDPPETPVVIKPVDGARYGGGSTVNVIWTCFDIDGDPLTYTLEYYDGRSWAEVATGLANTAYNFTIPATLSSITDLKFRVKAFDGHLSSDYGYSGRMIVDRDAPANIVVSLTKADGKVYTVGTWTNQDVTVKALSIEDLSPVTFKYSLEDKIFVAGVSKVVTSGVHEVYIQAADSLDNKSEFGGYLVKIDKQAPAVPNTSVSMAGNKARISMSLKADPGGSGNNYVAAPDGSQLQATQSELEWTTSKNGAYAFTIVDRVGNSTKFSVTVNVLDTTPPEITCDSGNYRIGDTSASPITAVLSFTDDKSEIAAKGYAIDQNETYSGVYSSYKEALTVSEPGTYYIHAFAQNTLGLNAYKTFGPFIVGAAAEPTPAPSDDQPVVAPVLGNVVVKADNVIKGAKQIRLPGGEWQDSIVLDNIKSGTYLVEVMDENGTISMLKVTITDEDIALGLFQPSHEGLPVWLWVLLGLLLLLILILLLWRNVIVAICAVNEDGSQKELRTYKRLRMSRKTLEIKLNERHITGSTYGRVTLSRGLSRRMQNKILLVTIDGGPVLQEAVPDSRGKFTAVIESWK